MKILISFSYLFFAYLATFFINKLIYYFLIGIKKTNNQKLFNKVNTIKNFLNSVIYVVIYFIAFILILNIWQVNIVPFLTGAGLIGLTLSLGFQTLIKDIISGMILIFDNNFNIGDEIQVAGYRGKIYKITLRQTVLKDEKGNKIYIQNSQISSFLKIKK